MKNGRKYRGGNAWMNVMVSSGSLTKQRGRREGQHAPKKARNAKGRKK